MLEYCLYCRYETHIIDFRYLILIFPNHIVLPSSVQYLRQSSARNLDVSHQCVYRVFTLSGGCCNVQCACVPVYGVPWNKTRLSNYIKVDVSDLEIFKNKAHNFLHPSNNPLDLNGRIVGGGKAQWKSKVKAE